MRKGVYVKQRDRTDCGAACLASLAAYYGLHLTVSRVRQFAGTNQSGTSLHGLAAAAGRLRLKARAVRMKDSPVSSVPLPAIFHVVQKSQTHHFVVVFAAPGKRVHYMDPAFGKMLRRPLHTFEKSWTGVVLITTPCENFEPGNERIPAGRQIWKFIGPQRSSLFMALACAIVCTTLGLTMSLFVQRIIDSVLPNRNIPLMNVLTAGMIVLLGFKILMSYIRSVWILKAGQKIDTRLILGYYNHLLRLPQRFFDNMRVGEIVSRVNDAVRIRAFINDTAIALIVHVLTILFSLSVMFCYSRKLGFLILMTLPVYYFVYRLNNRFGARWQREMMESGALLENQFVESVQCMTTIRRFEVGSYFSSQTENRFIPVMNALYRSGRMGIFCSHISEGISGMMIVVFLWAGSYFVISGELSAGEFISFYMLLIFFTQPVLALIGSVKGIQDALIAADRLFEITSLPAETEPETNRIESPFPAGDLIFDRMHFSYGPGSDVFTGLQMRIPRYRMTAIVGESGSGKSTLISLIQKLYSPDVGTISIGSENIWHIPTSVLRKRIAAVPQHTDLFQGTIISNIALGENTPDIERIIKICVQLDLHDFISGLPEAYHSVICEQGMNLSGGQRQRIGIARALYLRPSFLLLDEATSALDPVCEQLVYETLRSYQSAGTTMMVVAHRLSTIKKCDSIIFLAKGKMVSAGTHAWMLSENPAYQHWVRLNSH